MNTIGHAQIYLIDSNRVSVEKNEFRHIIQSNIVLNYQDSLISYHQEKERILNSIIGDKDSIITYKDQQLDLLNERIEEVTPSFLEKPLIVATITSTVWLLIIIFL